MKALVVGYGSIGKRHARLLRSASCDVAVVSRRTVDFAPRYADIASALVDWRPDYVVVAGRTAEHHGDLCQLISLGHTGRVLVEKPLFDRPQGFPDHRFASIAVAYNMRFHPLFRHLREWLAGDNPVSSVQASVGQYLPDWRPGSDYRASYSARHQDGGGVLRDLSHELDYVQWLFGKWTRLTALGGHFSALEINSEDTCNVLMACERCPSVNIHLSYLDRAPRREIVVNTSRHTLRADFIRGEFHVDGKLEARVEIDRDFMYLSEHRAMLDGNAELLCSLGEGIETLSVIEGAERAMTTQTWINR